MTEQKKTQSTDYTITDSQTLFASYNENYQRKALDPLYPRFIFYIENVKADKASKVEFLLARNEETHVVSLLPYTLPIITGHAVAPELIRELEALAAEKLKNFRTEDDRVEEGADSIYIDFTNLFCADSDRSWDGDEYDPEDDFHQFLINKGLATAEKDDDENNGTLRAVDDLDDEIRGVFDTWILGSEIATSDHGSSCVELTVCFGGPNCFIRSWFSRSYTLEYSWGVQQTVRYFGSEISEWLDSMLGIEC